MRASKSPPPRVAVGYGREVLQHRSQQLQVVGVLLRVLAGAPKAGTVPAGERTPSVAAVLVLLQELNGVLRDIPLRVRQLANDGLVDAVLAPEPHRVHGGAGVLAFPAG